MQEQQWLKMNKRTFPVRSILSAIVIAIMLFATASIDVYANTYTSTEVEAMYSDGYYTSSDGKWYSTYAKGAGYKGQGVLLYLLEKDGGGPVAGTTPKAYACGAAMEEIELHARDKYNRYPEVTEWEGTDPYWSGAVSKSGAMMHSSITSNVPSIKAWLKTPYDNNTSTQGIWMVQTIWGDDACTRFRNEEIILIAEPIVAVQYSQYRTTQLLSFDTSMSMSEILYNLKGFQIALNAFEDTEISSDLEDLLNQSIDTLENIDNIPIHAQLAAVQSVREDLSQLITGTNFYKKLGDPMAGTAKELIAYYRTLTPENEWNKAESGGYYYRRSASACSFIPSTTIICENANFTLWPAGSEARQYHSDSTINTYSIGMLAMLAFTEDVGDLTIYKVYQDENGNHIRTTITAGMNPYSITEESNTVLIEWKTSTIKPDTAPSINTPWNTLTDDKPTVQSGTNPTTVTTSEDERAVYILYKETESQQAGEWTLQESEIAKPVSTGTRTSNTTLSFTLGTLESCNTDHLICTHNTSDNCGGSYCDHSCPGTGECATTCTHADCDDCEDRGCTHSHSTANGCYKKCDSYTLQDSSLTFKLKNTKENDYPKVIAVSYGTSNNTVSGTRTLTTAETLTPSGFTYDFVIYRGNDTLNCLLKHII